MNKEQELQAKRNELFNHSEATLARIRELDAEIAEEKKPKLRHGDYGFYQCKNKEHLDSPYVHISDEGTIRPIGKNKSYLDQTSTEGYFTFRGNIFDDLRAKTETVTAFKIKSSEGERDLLHCFLDGDNDVRFVFDDCDYMELDKVKDLILKLQQIHATGTRKQAQA